MDEASTKMGSFTFGLALKILYRLFKKEKKIVAQRISQSALI